MLISGGPISSVPISARRTVAVAIVIVELPCPYIPARVDESSLTAGRPDLPVVTVATQDQTFLAELRVDETSTMVARADDAGAIALKIDETAALIGRVDDIVSLFGRIDEVSQVDSNPPETSLDTARVDNSFEISLNTRENELVESAPGRADECR